jgi:hypothetical protein
MSAAKQPPLTQGNLGEEAKAMEPTSPSHTIMWLHGPVSELSDAELDQYAHAAFAWWRQCARESVTPRICEHLAALQAEFMHRFPAGDLSATIGAVASGAAGTKSADSKRAASA